MYSDHMAHALIKWNVLLTYRCGLVMPYRNETWKNQAVTIENGFKALCAFTHESRCLYGHFWASRTNNEQGVLGRQIQSLKRNWANLSLCKSRSWTRMYLNARECRITHRILDLVTQGKIGQDVRVHVDVGHCPLEGFHNCHVAVSDPVFVLASFVLQRHQH